MRIIQTLDEDFCPTSLIYLFVFLSSVLAIFYSLLALYQLQTFWYRPFKRPENETLISYGALANLTSNSAPIIEHLFFQ